MAFGVDEKVLRNGDPEARIAFRNGVGFGVRGFTNLKGLDVCGERAIGSGEIGSGEVVV